MTTDTETLLDVSLDQIRPNPRQPRQHFDAARLQALADSIREQGLIQPLVITPNDDGYYLVAGERRWRAAQLAGLKTVPAVVRAGLDARAMAEMGLIENVQREDLTPAEEAQAYETLATEFGLSDEEIGRRVGKDRATVANLRRLLQLPPAIRDLVGSEPDQLPQRFARAECFIQYCNLVPVETAADTVRRMARAARDPSGNFWETPDHILLEAVGRVAVTFHDEWDVNWLKSPVTATDDQGEIQIRDCRTCPFFLSHGRGDQRERYCANTRCLTAKRSLWRQKRVADLSKSHGIPIAATDEAVTLIEIGWENEAQVRRWLAKPPAHLRLVAAPASDASPYTHRAKQVLGTEAVCLATTRPVAAKTGKAIVPDQESDASRQRRTAAEQRERAKRRAEKAQQRRQRFDVLWLATNLAAKVGLQIDARGGALAHYERFTGSRVRPNGSWPDGQAAIEANRKARTGAAGPNFERLLREAIVLHLLHETIASYDAQHTRDWARATKLARAVVEAELGLKLPRGWDQPPIHRTESNCWRCGVFTSADHVTQRDLAEGWQVVMKDKAISDVRCPTCAKRKKTRS